MASTSSLGAQSSTSSSHAQLFYEEFNKSLQEIREAIAESSGEAELVACFDRVAKARGDLTAITEQLPPYDRQKHEQRLREVNELLAQKRAGLAPRAKFAFKRKPKAKVEGVASDVVAAGIGATATSQDGKRLKIPVVAAAGPSGEEDFLSIKDRIGQRITLDDLNNRSGKGSDLHLLNLQDCFIDLRRRVATIEEAASPAFLALQLRNLHRCVVFCGTVHGSTMIHDSSDCLVLIECKQFRMHSSLSMAILIATKSVATIEHCRKIQFAPLSPSQHPTTPRVQDFDHIQTAQPSTNWSLMEEGPQEAVHEVAEPSSSCMTINSKVDEYLRAAGLAQSTHTTDTPQA